MGFSFWHYVHSLSGGGKIKFNFATAFKTPNIKEADSNYSLTFNHSGTTFLGNSNLKPETSTNIEIGFMGSGDGFNYNAAIFKTDLKDMIGLVNIGGNQQQYTNVAKAIVKGVEVSTDFDLSDTLFLKANYTHMRTDDGEGGELSYRPDNIIGLKLNKLFGNNLNTDLSLNHIGKSKDGANTVQPYTLYSFALNKKLSPETKLQFAIDNLTDEKLDNAADNHMSELVGRKYKLSFAFKF